MPVTYDVIENGRVVLQYWSGQVTSDEILTHEQQHLTDPRITSGAAVLVDARAAHCAFTEGTIRALAGSLYGAFPHQLNITKCVFLINVDTYPLAWVYEKCAARYGISVRSFSFLDGACAWLGLETTVVASHLDRIKQAQAAPPPNT